MIDHSHAYACDYLEKHMLNVSPFQASLISGRDQTQIIDLITKRNFHNKVTFVSIPLLQIPEQNAIELCRNLVAYASR